MKNLDDKIAQYKQLLLDHTEAEKTDGVLADEILDELDNLWYNATRGEQAIMEQVTKNFYKGEDNND